MSNSGKDKVSEVMPLGFRESTKSSGKGSGKGSFGY